MIPKFIKRSLFSILLCLTTTVGANNFIFTVLITDGEAFFEVKNKKHEKVLSIGDKIGYGSIILKHKTIFSIIHENGNIIEINDTGIYVVEELEKRVIKNNKKEKSIVLANIFLKKYSDGRNYYSYVSRGSPIVEMHSTRTYTPNFLTRQKTTIYWDAPRLNIDDNHLKLTNYTGDLLLKYDCKETNYTIDFNNPFIIDSIPFILTIDNAESSGSLALKFLPDSVYKEYLKEEKILEQENTNTNSLILLKGIHAEKYGLYIDEYNHYKTLIALLRQHYSTHASPDGLNKLSLFLIHYY